MSLTLITFVDIILSIPFHCRPLIALRISSMQYGSFSKVVAAYTFMQFSQNLLSLWIGQTFRIRPPKRPFVQLIIDQSKPVSLNTKLMCLFFVLWDFTSAEVIGNGLHPSYICISYIMDMFWCNRRHELDVNWKHDRFSDEQGGDNSDQCICFSVLLIGNTLDLLINQLV